MEIETDYLKELQLAHPLSPLWLKKDYVSDIEAVYIYYNIEPFDHIQLTGPIEQYFYVFDKEGIWEVMKQSNLNGVIVYGRGLDLKSFVRFLFNKGFEIPNHLKCLLTFSKENADLVNPSLEKKEILKEELLEYNLNSFSPIQLQRMHARTFAALYWKKQQNKGCSANQLVKWQPFKDAMKSIGAEKTEAETFAKWISDLGPRSKKNKKLKSSPS